MISPGTVGVESARHHQVAPMKAKTASPEGHFGI
jgi:hypothetical protein